LSWKAEGAALPAAAFPGQIKKIFTFERTFLLILLIAFILRFAFLDLKLFHHDEAIHAWFSYNLLTTGAWQYDPSYHGPFLYYVTAGMFALFGDSDLVARILPSLAGFLLVPLVYCIYRLGYLDKKQTILAALFIAVSPDMVYFSRFLRHDIFMLFFTLLLVVALLAYFSKGRTLYAVLGRKPLLQGRDAGHPHHHRVVPCNPGIPETDRAPAAVEGRSRHGRPYRRRDHGHPVLGVFRPSRDPCRD
jgi:protein-S-isoprenylcysteine O-methyltransferase Ste14